MRRLIILSLVAASSVALTGCPGGDAVNTNANIKTNANTANNTIIVTNANNTSTGAGNTMTGNRGNWNANITRDEYDKNKEDYANRAKETGSTIGSGVNDGWLWTKTRAALATTNELRESTINVDVNNEVVTLKGSVATAEQKAKAEQVAKGIDGVKSVTNQLTVKAGDSLTNQMTSGNTNTANSNTKK